ncbi:MAG: thymidine phosphorylase [Mycoplasmataceae bacterium]|jgi:pyrimidine-nucleoside phosphorylase|nr:thymidine phosphorylase [Mycoplasmataceae bacterium]
MDILTIIEKKRSKQILSKEEINFFINAYTKLHTIKDYQAAALLMAINLNGLNDQEIYYLTDAMLHSGNVVDLSSVKGIKIDKHSTGGVGDKVSLILAPICVALGLKVAKLSGKGLGHTGGTIDKLESINVNCNISKQKYLSLLKTVGMFIASQTEDLVPADKFLYALRNSTGTVQSIPLIASSIASKKLALKTDYIFLDVKVGDGGFNRTIEDATKLSNELLKIFKAYKRKCLIHITNMTQPLGRAIGNALEIKSSIEFLKGNPECNEVKILIYDFLIDILITTKKVNNRNKAKILIDEVISNGAALKIFYKWVCAQGANEKLITSGEYFHPKYHYEIKASKSGFVNYKSTKSVGLSSFFLGAGRLRKEDPLDYQAGIYLNKIRNEPVHKGDVVATLYSSKPIKKEAITHFVNNLEINQKPLKISPVIVKVMK